MKRLLGWDMERLRLRRESHEIEEDDDEDDVLLPLVLGFETRKILAQASSWSWSPPTDQASNKLPHQSTRVL